MALGGPNIYPSSGTWLGISREFQETIHAATVSMNQLSGMLNPVCDYARYEPHDQPVIVIAAGRLKDMKIITRTLCFDCCKFIMQAGTVGEPVYGNTQPFRWDEIEIRHL